MSNRLDQDREKELTPIRMNYALVKLDKAGILEFETTETSISFLFKGNKITLFPYSGWFQGKGVKAGRGIDKLIKQIK